MITINGTIVEYASHPSPFSLYYRKRVQGSPYYEYGTYGIVIGKEFYEIDTDGTLLTKNVNTNAVSLLSATTIPGVSPQLQYGATCGPTAVANYMWYWSSHGYASLCSGKTFAQVRTDMINRFNAAGGYANKSVPSVANAYAHSKNSKYKIVGKVINSPLKTTLINEINAFRPCLLGFKAGSVYGSVGHMTMCYGYVTSGASMYVTLADGHSTSPVQKLWTSYNDCLITLQISK